MKIPNKRELQRIASNKLSDIDFKDFMNLYKLYILCVDQKKVYNKIMNSIKL